MTKDMSNGAVTRLLAWKKLLPNLEYWGLFEQENNLRLGDSVIIDLTGENLSVCLKAWRKWRRYGPVCFLQDSQVRYNFSGYSEATFWKDRLIFAVNAGRGLIRETFCHILFRRVGYVSRTDFLFGIWGYELRWLQSSQQLFSETAAVVKAPLKYLRMVGNFSYGPNREGALRILNNAAIQMVLRKFGLKVILSGASSNELIGLFPKDIVAANLSGPFRDLSSLIRDDQVLVCPSLYGSGIKNKILEAPVIGSFILAWEGFRREFPYPVEWTDFFHSPSELAEYIEFLCTRVGPNPGLVSYFQLAEEYRMGRFLGDRFLISHGREATETDVIVRG